MGRTLVKPDASCMEVSPMLPSDNFALVGSIAPEDEREMLYDPLVVNRGR